MRRRLVAVFIAVTAMIAIAFVLPLALLVRDVARDTALDDASAQASALAPVLAVTDDPDVIEVAISRTRAGSESRLAIHLLDGRSVGGPLERSERVEQAFTEGRAFAGTTGSGAEVVMPVARSAGDIAVVHVVVSGEALGRGVGTAWLTLVLVGLAIVAVSVVLADRFAQSISRPVAELAEAAHRLGDGELDVRVTPAGPPEIVAVGVAFNQLAERVAALLQAQREDVADLAHRLRSPLAALRLQLDQVDDPQVRAQVSASTDALARSLDQVIGLARRSPPAGPPALVDVADVLRERAEFWGALADEQTRAVETRYTTRPVVVRLAEDDLRAMIDVVFENVFAHTRDGTAYRVSLDTDGLTAVIEVADAGAGFPDIDAVERGVSDDSTGLGLDIARRTAESAGGTITLGASELGGAAVSIRLPINAPDAGRARRTTRAQPRSADPTT